MKTCHLVTLIGSYAAQVDIKYRHTKMGKHKQIYLVVIIIYASVLLSY